MNEDGDLADRKSKDSAPNFDVTKPETVERSFIVPSVISGRYEIMSTLGQGWYGGGLQSPRYSSGPDSRH